DGDGDQWRHAAAHVGVDHGEVEAGEPVDDLVERLPIRHDDHAADDLAGVDGDVDGRAADDRVEQVVVDVEREAQRPAVRHDEVVHRLAVVGLCGRRDEVAGERDRGGVGHEDVVVPHTGRALRIPD